MNRMEHDVQTQSRLLAKLVRVLLARESFATLACLTEALKVECARLRIRWTNDAISEAYRVIESNTPLPGLRPIRRLTPLERLEPLTPSSRDDASAILARVYAEFARRAPRPHAEAS
jgi:hypothetical protein